MSIFEKINNAAVDYAHEPVPLTERKGPFSLFTVWFVVMVNLTFIFFGINISRSMPLMDAIIACIIGQVIAGLLISVTAIFAAKTNLAAGKLLPFVFGKHVAILIMVFNGLMGIAWFGFQLELFSQSLTHLMGLNDIFLNVVVAVSGLFMISSGIIGFKAVEWLSRVATPFLLLLIAYPTFDYFAGGGSLESLFGLEIPEDHRTSIGITVSMLLGGLAVPLIITADIMRYARTAKESFWTTFAGQTIGAVSIVILSLFLGRISGEADFVSIIAGIGFSGIGLLLIMLATWTTNDTNIYISSLAFSSIFKKIRKWIIALACGIAGIATGMFGVVEYFMQMLSLLGMFFGPAGAVFQIGIMSQLNRTDFTKPVDENYKWGAVIAFISGCFIAICTNSTENLGLGLFSLTTIPMMDGYISAGAIYLISMGLCKNRKDHA